MSDAQRCPLIRSLIKDEREIPVLIFLSVATI